jgi:hypothetical protein
MVEAAEAERKRKANQSIPGGAQNFALQHLEITEILEDHLLCGHVNPDDTVSAAPVYVMKPFAFQGSISGGAYKVGDRIYAAVTDTMGQVDTADSHSTRTVLVDVNVNGGGGALERVAHLPAIDPEQSPNVERKVFWCSYETGLEEGFTDADGNDGVWTNAFPQQRWYPAQNYSANSGIPVS